MAERSAEASSVFAVSHPPKKKSALAYDGQCMSPLPDFRGAPANIRRIHRFEQRMKLLPGFPGSSSVLTPDGAALSELVGDGPR